MAQTPTQVTAWKKANPEKVRAYRRKYYLLHKEEIVASKKAYRHKNPEAFRVRNKRWKLANPEKVKASIRKTRYGISDEEFKAKQKEQLGLCAICRIGSASHIDHCHKTGKIRGLLCVSCNPALGSFRDSKEILERAIKYLSKYE